MGYNRDTQEDKPPMFDSLSLVARSLPIVRKMLESSTWNVRRMADSTIGDFATVTDGKGTL